MFPGGGIYISCSRCKGVFIGAYSVTIRLHDCVPNWIDYFVKYVDRLKGAGDMDDDIKQSIINYPKVVAALVIDTPGCYKHREVLLAPMKSFKAKDAGGVVFKEKGLMHALIDIAEPSGLQ